MPRLPPALLVVVSVLAAALLALIALAAADLALPVDDAYISLSYARTLASGAGLRLTPMAAPVEGFSNPLWVLLLAAAARVGANPPVAATVLGWLAGVATCVVVVRAVYANCGNWAPTALAGAAFVTASGLGFHLASGLETAAAGLALTSAISGALAGGGQRLTASMALALLAFALLRPEGAVVFAAWWLLVRDRRPTRAHLMFVAPFLTWLLFRWVYFGHWLPNSVVAKQGAPLSVALAAGLRYVGAWTSAHAGILVLAIIGVSRLPLRVTLLTVVPVALLFATALLGAHVEGYPFQRYLYPALPVAIVLAGLGAASLMRRLQTERRLVVGTLVAGAVLVGAVGAHVVQRRRDASAPLEWTRITSHARAFAAGDLVPRDEPRYPPYHRLAAWLHASGRTGQRTAQQEIGTTAYYSGLDVLDTFGLTDATVARTPGRPSGRAAPDYVFGRQPDVFVIRLAGDGLRAGLLADDVYAASSRMALEYDLQRFFPDESTPLVAAFTRRHALLRAQSLVEAVPAQARYASAAPPDLADAVVRAPQGSPALAAAARLHFKRWIEAIQWNPATPDGLTVIPLDVPSDGDAAFAATVRRPPVGEAGMYAIDLVTPEGARVPALRLPEQDLAPGTAQDVTVSLARWRGQRVHVVLQFTGSDASRQRPGWAVWMEPRLLVMRNDAPPPPAPVVTGGRRDAVFVSDDVPATMRAGQRRAVTLTFRNTGQRTWTDGDQYRLGLQRPQDSALWSIARMPLPTPLVAPGETVTFRADVVAPTAPGTYDFEWRMLQEGETWFGAASPARRITVTP